MKLYVKYHESGESGREEHGEGSWDYTWWENNYFEVWGVSLNKDDIYNFETFDVCFDVVEGETVHVLYMIYSTGDTFGHSRGNGEILWVFKDFDKAEAAAKSLRENENSYSIDILDEENNFVRLNNPGSGYFERIEQITIESFRIGPLGSLRDY